MSAYVICDEPQLKGVQNYITPPYIPFFTCLLIGPLYGWIWLLLNSYLISQRISRKESFFFSVGILGTIAGYESLYQFVYWQKEIFHTFPYLGAYLSVSIDLLKIFISYHLLLCQQDKYQVFKEFYEEEGRGKKRIYIGLAIAYGLSIFAKVLFNPILIQFPYIKFLVKAHV